MDFLLYCDVTSETGAALAAYLEIPSGNKMPEERVDLLIRWGSPHPVPRRARRIINKLASVRLAADKLASLKLLNEKQVRVPSVLSLEEATQLAAGFTPILGRKIRHSRGKDIQLCLQKIDIERAIKRKCTYFTAYIPTVREYRVHVFRGEVIRISQKLLTDRTKQVAHIRNLDHGYVFGQVKTPLTNEQLQLCIDAVQHLGLDFGAVDLIIGDDGLTYILEVNTGPSLIEIGIELYGEKLKPLLTPR